MSLHSRLGVDFTPTGARPSSACQSGARDAARYLSDSRTMLPSGAEESRANRREGAGDPQRPRTIECGTLSPRNGGEPPVRRQGAGKGAQTRCSPRWRKGLARWQMPPASCQWGWGYNVLHGVLPLPAKIGWPARRTQNYYGLFHLTGCLSWRGRRKPGTASRARPSHRRQ